MCYSAQIYAEFKRFKREFGAIMDIETYVATFWPGDKKQRAKAPRALIRELEEIGPPELRAALLAQDQADIAELEEELFALRRRVGDAQRALQVKVTKRAQEDVRIGTNKGKAVRRRLDILKGLASDDDRVFPGMYAPVMVWESGQRVVKPMRYLCRPCGTPSFFDRKFPTTYNARRDKLEGSFWGGLFGASHGLMVANRFYENVEGPDGKNRVLEFTPRDGEPMLVACLWSRWTDPAGKEPDLLSFAAITDEPEPEVAEAGHDRTIINIKPEHVEAWLNPDPSNLEALYAIFDDKRHPYYEHRVAA